MKNFVFLTVTVLLIGVFFSEPIRHGITQFEAGFPIEKLAYVPKPYPDVNEDMYFNLRRGLPAYNYVETLFQSEEGFFKFSQTAINKSMNLYLDSIDSGTYYNKETIMINDQTATVTYYRDGSHRFVWFKDQKRYDLLTDDNGLARVEVERIESGLQAVKVDFLEPLKTAWNSYITFTKKFF